MRNHLLMAVLISVLFSFPVLTVATPAADKNSQQNASELIKSGQRAVAQIVKTARGDAILEPDKAETKPFWEAMQQARRSLQNAEQNLEKKDQMFFSALAETGAAIQQAEIALDMNDSKNTTLARQLQTLADIVQKLNDNYSKEAVRLNQGEQLTAAERAQLDKLKLQQKELTIKLAKVEKNIGKNSKKIQVGLKKIRQNSKQISRARYNSADFVGAIIAARLMSGWIWGWHWWWGPWGIWGPDFIIINIDIWWDSIVIMPYDWDLVDADIDVGDLELDDIEFADVDIDLQNEWLKNGNFDLEKNDLIEMTQELPQGWGAVNSEVGEEVIESYQDNFSEPVFMPEPGIQTFDDIGVGDFGSSFDDF